MKAAALTLVLAIAACGAPAPAPAPATTATGLHSWSTYHWPTPRAPAVFDKTKGTYWAVAAHVADWATLGTPMQPTMTTRRADADVTVTDGRSTQWLGLAQISLDADGHITSGKVTLNTAILSTDPRFGPEASAHVLCQELGHIWGLNHNRSALDTCMNDCATAATEAEWLACLNHPDGTTPNAHDVEQLLIIYDHVDPDPDPAPTSDGGPPCRVKPNHPNCKLHTVHTAPLW